MAHSMKDCPHKPPPYKLIHSYLTSKKKRKIYIFEMPLPNSSLVDQVKVSADWFWGKKKDDPPPYPEVEFCDPDCGERAACDWAGTEFHRSCGSCPDHRMPRHHCGCVAL